MSTANGHHSAKSETAPPDDPLQSARAAGLRYVTDASPGIRRLRHRSGFRYLAPNGKPLRDPNTLARIRSLAIPPAWTDIWICPSPNGHLQATGRDARGRKQSRYHPHWREVRDETKYSRMTAFGKALPKIRKHVETHLALPGLPREKVLATVVSLLESTFLRVGNTEYARENHSYGLTTLHNRHVQIQGSTIRFHFKGKSGIEHTVGLSDRRLARILRRCLDLPGYELFQYLDEDGQRHTIDSSDVNTYLFEITGDHFTAKDFRTWAGTILACTLLRSFEQFGTESEAKKNVVAAIKTVARQLGNTPAVCRKCYVHPHVIECYLTGSLGNSFRHRITEEALREPGSLRHFEGALMRLLKAQAK